MVKKNRHVLSLENRYLSRYTNNLTYMWLFIKTSTIDKKKSNPKIKRSIAVRSYETPLKNKTSGPKTQPNNRK